MRTILLGLFALVLTGCMSMPLSTMVKMASFTPYDIDAQAMRIAVRTDRAVNIEQGAVTMSMSYETQGNADFEPVSMKYKFEVVKQPDIKLDYEPILRDGIESNERLSIFRLSDEDAQKLSQLLDTAKRYKDADIKGTGSFSIGVTSECFGNIQDKEELLVDLFLKTSQQEGYFLFLEDIDVIEEANSRDFDLKKANKC